MMKIVIVRGGDKTAPNIAEQSGIGHPMTKATCLWLKGLPLLKPTNVLTEYFVNWTKYKGSHNSHARSKTFPGIAAAMAQQWGGADAWVQRPLWVA